MRVKFKGNETTYECTEPVEQKVFRSGTAAGWAVMFHIYGDISSSEADKIVTPENISEITFINDDERQTSFAVTGYSVLTACIIRHKEALTVTELQFTKANKTGEEGSSENEEI